MSKQEDLAKVSLVTILGLSILIFSLFWLKGHKLYNLQKVKVYFEDVSGLEEGSIVRWSGLRVGVVEDIKPVLLGRGLINQPRTINQTTKNEFLELSSKEADEAKKIEDKITTLKDSDEVKTLKSKLESLKDISRIHLQQGLAYKQQKLKEGRNHVEVTLTITKKDVPLGPLKKVSIVPTGFIR